MRNLDWKWIGIGVLIMVALNIAAGFVLALVLGPEVQGATNVEDITLSGGQVALAAVINFLSFVIGGFIVGIKSAGRTDPRARHFGGHRGGDRSADFGQLHGRQHDSGGLVPFAAGVDLRLAWRASTGNGLNKLPRGGTSQGTRPARWFRADAAMITAAGTERTGRHIQPMPT